MKLNNRPSRRTRSLLSVVPGLLLLASPLPAADLGSAGPVPYGTRVVVSGLKGPNAIVLSPQGGLLVAEPAADGRPAAISMVDLATDALTLLFNGPDLPADPLLARLVSGAGGEVTSIATSAKGDLFWTASGEGVIWGQPAGGTAAILLQGLEQPTGIALDPSGTRLFFTEVPTPGVAGAQGGRNRVSVLDLATLRTTVVHSGDPDPTSLAAGRGGTIYWTSTSQGVVVEASSRSGERGSAVLRLTAKLTGRDEVPPVTTTAQGDARFVLFDAATPASGGSTSSTGNGSMSGGRRESRDGGGKPENGPALLFDLEAVGIAGATAARLHAGDPGKVGPPVAVLSTAVSKGKEEKDDSGKSGELEIEGKIRVADLVGPFAGNWAGFVADLKAGRLYVEIETSTHPAGEIRGQLVPAVVDPPAQAPKGTITSPTGNVTITAGQSVTFSAAAADPGGSPVTVLWNFGDGTTSTLLAPPPHTYAAAGKFTVRFTATNANGVSDPAPPTRTITVTSATVQPPNGTITQPTGNPTITAGQSVTFAGTATDPGGLATTVLWSFGDGTTSTLLSPGAHTYANAGSFAVTFTVKNSAGDVDPTPATRTVTVNAAGGGNGGGGGATTLSALQAQVFTPRCSSCHGGKSPSAGMNLSAGQSFSNLVNVPATNQAGTRVVPGSPATSVLVLKLQSSHGGASAADRTSISSWITAGALDN